MKKLYLYKLKQAQSHNMLIVPSINDGEVNETETRELITEVFAEIDKLQS